VTLIATAISKYGIIQASDSNVVKNGLLAAGGSRKVFAIPGLNGALAIAGTLTVGGEVVDTWMPACIAAYTAGRNPSLEGFADHLGRQLSNETSPKEQNAGSLIHIAGYVGTPEGSHPEFYFVRNIQGINPQTGAYEGTTDTWDVSEDFWNRDYLKPDVAQALAQGGRYRYFNGFHPGRIAYVGASQMLEDFFRQVRDKPEWKFREPQSLDEAASIVALEISVIGTLMKCSDYDPQPIGGDTQIESIPPPADAVDF
jgi:hypothetical protein